MTRPNDGLQLTKPPGENGAASQLKPVFGRPSGGMAMTTRSRRIVLVGILGAASLGLASPTRAADCKSSSREPPTLRVRVLGRSAGPVTGARVVVAARKGSWSSTALTDGTGDAGFKPPKAGTYVIRVTCDVSSCGDKRKLEQTVDLQNGSSTSALLTTESVVIY